LRLSLPFLPYTAEEQAKPLQLIIMIIAAKAGKTTIGLDGEEDGTKTIAITQTIRIATVLIIPIIRTVILLLIAPFLAAAPLVAGKTLLILFP